MLERLTALFGGLDHLSGNQRLPRRPCVAPAAETNAPFCSVVRRNVRTHFQREGTQVLSLTSRKGLISICILAAAAIVAATSASAARQTGSAGSKIFNVTNLVADAPGRTVATDPALVNGWGLGAAPTSPWWTSNNGTNTSTLYNGRGHEGTR